MGEARVKEAGSPPPRGSWARPGPSRAHGRCLRAARPLVWGAVFLSALLLLGRVISNDRFCVRLKTTSVASVEREVERAGQRWQEAERPSVGVHALGPGGQRADAAADEQVQLAGPGGLMGRWLCGRREPAGL